jgi:glycosyltransferase involved in cell wall biosynthesis
MGRWPRVRILALAYACEPGKGSEPGTGWMWSRMLARLGEVTVMTRSNNRSVIESALVSTPEADNLTFEFIDLPQWARSWKRGQRGIRLYYILWQFAALRRAQHLHRTKPFDLVWHVTMSNYWLGSVGGLIGPPFVFGPTSGGVRECLRIQIVGIRGLLYEVARAGARATGRMANPLVSSAWKRASLILVNNADTKATVPVRFRRKVEVFPNVLLEPTRQPARRKRAPAVALFAGRLLPWKGVALAIRAIGRLPGWRLIVCGEGPDEVRLRRLSQKLGVAERVEFRGWMARDELHDLMRRDVGVFVFPSVHDECGWVVAEAAAQGLPVVCVRRGGPPLLRGIGCDVALQDVEVMTSAIARSIESLRGQTSSSSWDMDARQPQLARIVRRYGLVPSLDIEA